MEDKLTENIDIFTYGGEYYNGHNDFIVIDGHVDDEENEALLNKIVQWKEDADKYKKLDGEPFGKYVINEDNAKIVKSLEFYNKDFNDN